MLRYSTVLRTVIHSYIYSGVNVVDISNLKLFFCTNYIESKFYIIVKTNTVTRHLVISLLLNSCQVVNVDF